MADWVRVGQPLETFWLQTPRTFAAAVKGYLRRIDDRRRHFAWLALQTGRFAQMDPRRFPTVAQLCGDDQMESVVEFSNDQMLARMRKLKRGTPGMTIRRVA